MKKFAEVWQLLMTSPEKFRGGGIWKVILNINGAVQAIGLALLVLFFLAGVVKTSTIMKGSGIGGADKTALPQEMITAIEDCGFFESIPLSTFAGQPTQSVGVNFLKSYAAVCLKGAVRMSDRIVKGMLGL